MTTDTEWWELVEEISRQIEAVPMLRTLPSKSLDPRKQDVIYLNKQDPKYRIPLMELRDKILGKALGMTSRFNK
jgi:hypothetical protein